MRQKSETVKGVDGQKGQPKIESKTCQGCKIDPFPTIRLFVGPTKQWWQECDQKYEPIDTQNDHQSLSIGLDVVTETTWTSVQDVGLEDVHDGIDDAIELSSSLGYWPEIIGRIEIFIVL